MHIIKAILWVAIASSAPMLAYATDGTEDMQNRQHRAWRPTAPAVQEAIWPATLEIAPPSTPGPESFGSRTEQIGGRGWTAVEHVSRPTMTIYRPIGPNSGAAVVVFPGGGFRVLAIDLEGTEVCDWLTRKGVTCVVLKYRVPGSGPWYSEDCQCHRTPSVPLALQDAQRTLRLVRQRAASLGIDPHKIGVLGFSAGGRMVADISNHLSSSYAAVDAADQQSARPDFAIALYPGHLWKKPGLALDPGVTIDPHAPPTLIIQAGDDPTDDVRHSMSYYLALQQAGVPVELHVYPQGGHAFGLRETSVPVTHWPSLAEVWMQSLGVLPVAKRH